MKGIIQNVQFAGLIYFLISTVVIYGIMVIAKRLKQINNNLERLIDLKTKEVVKHETVEDINK